MTKTLALAAVLVSTAAAAGPGTGDLQMQQLQQKIDDLGQQLQQMKEQLRQLKSQNEALAAQQDQQQTQNAPAKQAGGKTSLFDDLSLWGYGEVYYTRPLHRPALTEADLARAVFGIGYRFDDRTRFNSEFEVEHAIASSSDAGEFEVEQFYVDHQFNNWAALEGGLFLLPVGLLNEHHEPTVFYGVQRNFVETLIIPSTWREGGLAFHGSTAPGFQYAIGLTTGLDFGKWNFFPEDPTYRTALDLGASGIAPMQATHQELSFSNAQHLSQFAALNYSGVPGLLAGASVFTGKVSVPKLPLGLPEQRLTLWEAHLRWTPGDADFSALYARGVLSNTEAENVANSGTTNPVPAKFYGWYLQGAYTVWKSGPHRLAPFVRWERYDMGASFKGVAPGFTPVPTGLASDGEAWPQPFDRVWTYGVNFYVNPHVVLKADYQSFGINSNLTRFDLGLGLDF